jgi:hypothetical protein
MLIRENLYTEGSNPNAVKLKQCLKEFFTQESFDNGIDWSMQVLWATMTDEQCVVFCLKHPEYIDRFEYIK